MLSARDIRFKATGPETAQALRILLPVRIRISRPTGEQALVEARRVVEQFRQTTEQTEWSGGRVILSDMATADGKQPSELTIEQASKKEVRLQLVFSAVLTLPVTTDFWARTSAIARATDFLQKFSQMPREKDIDVEAEQAQLLVEDGAEKAKR
jgi:hypothetical protein